MRCPGARTRRRAEHARRHARRGYQAGNAAAPWCSLTPIIRRSREGGGFDWSDAGVGALSAVLVASASLGAAVFVRRRHPAATGA
jgi:hypothetical protein